MATAFAPEWKDYKALVLTETAGLPRIGEPVEALLAFYADQAQDLAREVRVVAVDPETHALSEVPSQVSDVRNDVTERDRGEPSPLRKQYDYPIWVPTVTARVAFLADINARSSKVFLVYHNNPNAEKPHTVTDLTVRGLGPGLTIENKKISVQLHPKAGVIDELTLKSKPEQTLVHKAELNGAIHWTPEIYSPPRPWVHASDCEQPRFEVSKGPVITRVQVWDRLPFVPEADVSVSYEFYPNQPYLKTSTAMRVDEVLKVMASRNGELVIRRGQLTHLAWYHILSNKVEVVDLEKMADLEEVLFEADTPWLTFFNPVTGLGLGGIQLEFANAGVENLPRVLNPHFYAIVGPVIYWSRAMNLTFGSSASQLMVEIPRGSLFWEKWAYVLYETAPDDQPWSPMLEWQKRLTQPLRLRLVEEIEERVPTIGTEILIDASKTGWEGRPTAKDSTPSKKFG